MKKFVEAHCPLDDNIAFWVDVKIMPDYKNWESLEYTKELKAKMFEEVPTTETTPHGTRKPTARGDHRKATVKAKQRHAEIVIIRKAKARRTWSDVCRRPWEYYGKNIDRLMGEVVVR